MTPRDDDGILPPAHLRGSYYAALSRGVPDTVEEMQRLWWEEQEDADDEEGDDDAA